MGWRVGGRQTSSNQASLSGTENRLGRKDAHDDWDRLGLRPPSHLVAEGGGMVAAPMLIAFRFQEQTAAQSGVQAQRWPSRPEDIRLRPVRPSCGGGWKGPSPPPITLHVQEQTAAW